MISPFVLIVIVYLLWIVASIRGVLARADKAVFLSQYYEKANPEAAAASAGGAHEIAQALEEEVAELKQGESNLFKSHNTNIGGLAYVSMAQDAGAPSASRCTREGSRKQNVVHVLCRLWQVCRNASHAPVYQV